MCGRIRLPASQSRLLVVDANIIQGLNRQTDLAPGFDFLVGDVLGSELEGKLQRSGENDAIALTSFEYWMRMNADRIWIAAMIGRVQRDQLRLAHPIRRSDVIDLPRTKAFRSYAASESCHWRDLRKYMDPAALRKEAAWNEEIMAVPLEWSRDPEFARRFSQARARLDKHSYLIEIGRAIHTLDVSTPLLRTVPAGPSRQWLQRTLANTPDRLFSVRFARVRLYYYIIGALKPTEIRNNCDDMQYAVLASYTGHLATHDGDLKDCMAALFPRVRVIDPIKEIPRTPSGGRS